MCYLLTDLKWSEVRNTLIPNFNMKEYRERDTYFFLSLSFLKGCWEQPWSPWPISVSAATFLRLKAFISSSSSRLFSSRFFFSSWCIRLSCSNLSWSWRWDPQGYLIRNQRLFIQLCQCPIPLFLFLSALLLSLLLCLQTSGACLPLYAVAPVGTPFSLLHRSAGD